MTRRSILRAVGAIVAAVLIAVPTLMLVAGRGGAPDASGGPAGEDVPDQDPLAWPWVYAQIVDPFGTDGYTLQAGTLGGDEPIIDLVVPLPVDPNEPFIRTPAVGRAVDGAVVFVADDGISSTVRRVAIAPNAVPSDLATVEQIVWALAVAPDGDHAYLALVSRDEPTRDLGIVRVSLDGFGTVDQVYDPAPGARSEPAVQLAAVAAFDIDLEVTPDGRHLLRRTCGGAMGCTDLVIDVETGAQFPMRERPVLAASGGLVLSNNCGPGDCFLEIADLATGATQRLGLSVEATLVSTDAGPVVVLVETDPAGAASARTIDPGDGSSRELVRAPAGGWVTLQPIAGDMRVSVPDGWVLLSVSVAPSKEMTELHLLAVPLDGGDPIEVPMPAIGPQHLGGARG